MIILYSTHCPKCTVLQKKLDKANIHYEICDDVDIIVKKGFTNMPVLEIENETLSFKQAVDWINERGCPTIDN